MISVTIGKPASQPYRTKPAPQFACNLMEPASMFGRKRTETEDRKMSDAPDDLGIPKKPSGNNPGSNPPGTNPPAANPPGPNNPMAPLARPSPAPLAARLAETPRAAPESPRPAEPSSRPATAVPGNSLAGGSLPGGSLGARRNDADLRKLIVGREISLSGEINSCDRLVIEGSVEANLQNCNEVDLAESGLFKGSATIDEIDVRGRFEGNLTVRKRLLIRATGRVSGTIRYGQIEIECGGQISGDVQAHASNEPLANVP
jgi:cytoskeletal protein CcmA (bactofilin family)